MGITIHYRGRLADLDRVEDFEDRVFDLALEMGGTCRVWRTSADHDPTRLVRGLILDLVPGQESTSLLISPEGWLVGLMQIEEAERGDLTGPPWCFVKTQFGSVEGHVALIELFTALKREFIPDLEISDEGGYWASRDATALAKRFGFLQAAIEGLADGLRRHGLTREAAEDPEILIERIGRVAEKVRRTLARASEHPPVAFSDEGEDHADAADVEAKWGELDKESRRAQERFHRIIEERLARGEEYETAFDGAMRDAGLADDEAVEDDALEDELFDDPWSGADPGADDEDWDDELAGEDDEDSPFDGPWSDVDPEDRADDSAIAENAAEEAHVEDRSEAEDGTAGFRNDRHPVLRRAQKFYLRLHEVFDAPDERFANAVSVLYRGGGDLCGGLAQALSRRGVHDSELGLSAVQLKRALRGAAFARGALYQFRGPGAPPKDCVHELLKEIAEIERQIFQELGQVRAERERAGDGS